jgi:hypothetical protein
MISRLPFLVNHMSLCNVVVEEYATITDVADVIVTFQDATPAIWGKTGKINEQKGMKSMIGDVNGKIKRRLLYDIFLLLFNHHPRTLSFNKHSSIHIIHPSIQALARYHTS